MISFIILIFLGSVTSSVSLQTNRISDKRLCGDPECKTPISKAIAIVQYSGDHELLVNTKRGDTVTVYSKNAGIVESLWGIENRGKRGYHPKSLLKEITVLNSSPQYEVPTELETINSVTEESVVSSETSGMSADFLPKNDIRPDKVKQLEIVDGTIIYPEESRIKEIEPSVTINNVEQLMVDQVKTLSVNDAEGNIDANVENFNTTDDEDLLEDQGIEIEQKVEMPSADKEDTEDGSNENEPIESELNTDYNNETLSNNDQPSTIDKEELKNDESDVKFDSEERDDTVVDSNSADISLSITKETDTSENIFLSDSVSNILKQDEDNLMPLNESNIEDHKSESDFDETSKVNSDTYFSDIISKQASDNFVTLELNSQTNSNDLLVSTEQNAVDGAQSDQTEIPDSSTNPAGEVNTNNIFADGADEHKAGPVESENEIFETTAKPDDTEYEKEILETTAKPGDTVSEEHHTIEITENATAKPDDIVPEEHHTIEMTENNESSFDSSVTQSMEDHSVNEIPDGENVDMEIASGEHFTEITENNQSNLDSSDTQSVENHSLNKLSDGGYIETDSQDLSFQSHYNGNSAVTDMQNTESQHVENEEVISPQDIPEVIENEKNTANILEEETDVPPEESLFTSLTSTLFSGLEKVSKIFSDVDKDNLNIKTKEELSSDKIEDIQNDKEESNIFPRNREEAAAVEANSMDMDVDVCKIGGACNKESSKPNLVSDTLHISFGDANNADIHTQSPVFSTDTLFVLVVTAVTVLCFILGYYYLEKKQHNMFFITKMNNLEKSLLYYKNEAASIKEELQKKEHTLSTIKSSSSDSDKTIMRLQLELETFKEKNAELEEQVSSLEKELETATETGLELNRMLSDFLSTQHGSENLVKSVEHLQKQLDCQQNTISEMNTNLSVKNKENESLQGEIKVANEKVTKLEEELDKVTDTLILVQKEKLDIQSKLEERNNSLHLQLIEASEKHQHEISEYTMQIANAQAALEEARETVAMRDSELTVLQDCLKELKAFEDGQGSERLNALMDVGHARAELMIITLERDGLKDRLKDEEDARKLLEDHVKIIQEEVSSLRLRYDEAEKEKREAETKLEVLSNYFKEKETQLQKELGLQEAMCIQKDGDVCSTAEKIKSLQEEIQNYKSQNEILKKEIVDQERSMKSQISTLEKKAHENWIAVRQAERKLEESRQEAGTLRNRLTLVEKNLNNTSQNELDATRVSNRLTAAESNGELPTSLLHLGISELPDSPLHYHQHRDGHPVSPSLIPGQTIPPPFAAIPPPLFIPPPPIPGVPFIPPPPPPLFPGDRRPPPLGRMSSPPPTRHYSPEPVPGYSAYDRTSPQHFTDDPLPGRFRHITPPPHLDSYAPRQPPLWDEPRSDFRPMQISHRDSPHESKGSALSSAHSSESLGKTSRHSGRV